MTLTSTRLASQYLQFIPAPCMEMAILRGTQALAQGDEIFSPFRTESMTLEVNFTQ